MLVQGVGDEVLSVTLAVVAVIVVTLLWISTRVRDRPPVRAVYIRAATPELAASAVDQFRNNQEEILEVMGLSSQEIGHEVIEETAEIADEPAPAVAAEPEPVLESQEDNSNSSTSSGIATDTNTASPVNTDNASTNGEGAANLATIKVRFMNETSIEVRERLTENLGRFISKHLDSHLNLASGERVRIIYNGRVLGQSQSTLGELGLTDNCVVHCLVQRSSAGQPARAGSSNSNASVGDDDDREFAVPNLFFILCGFLLSVMWIYYIAYAHRMSYASTISLTSITVSFLVGLTASFM